MADVQPTTSSATARAPRWLYASVDHRQPDLVKSATWLFQGLYIGINMPQAQTGPGKVWEPASGPEGEPQSWGGHGVNVVRNDADGLTVATWGALQRMSWPFWTTYVEELWALLPVDFQRLQGPLQANGFDFAHLQSYLSQVGQVDSLTPTG